MLDFLKEGTLQIHKNVERHNLAKHILSHTITPEIYEQLLLQNYITYYSIEEELLKNTKKIRPTLKTFISTEKSDFLRNDLEKIGIFKKMNLRIKELNITSEAAVIGALYVIEGSMMGTAIIGKHISNCDAIKEICQHIFYKQNPKQLAKRWKSFKDCIQQIDFNDQERDESLQSAKQTFLLF